MKKFVNYQSIDVGFIDGKFINATLFISIEHDEVTVCEHYVKINDYAEAMKTLRKIERLAGHSARLIYRDGFCRRSKWTYTGKTITFCDVKTD